MEQLVVITVTKPSWGHVWTPTKNDVFHYQDIIALNIQALDIEKFQLQRIVEDLAKYLEKVTSKIDNNDHSLTMNLHRKHDSCQMI